MLSKKTVLQWKNDVLKLNVYATLVQFLVFRKTKNNFQGVQVSQITLKYATDGKQSCQYKPKLCEYIPQIEDKIAKSKFKHVKEILICINICQI